jgi:hypothetical protein
MTGTAGKSTYNSALYINASTPVLESAERVKYLDRCQKVKCLNRYDRN